MKRHGPWTIIGSRPIFGDAWITVYQDEVIRPDGKPGTHDVVQLRQGVTVIAVDEQLTAHLTEEFHYAVGRVTLEGVSGGRDEGEEALPCAKRELREELGIEAAEWLDLGPLDPVTSIIAAPVRLFLARKLRFVEKEPEGTEQILHVTMPLKEAVERVMAGDITHAATCVAILKTARLLA